MTPRIAAAATLVSITKCFSKSARYSTILFWCSIARRWNGWAVSGNSVAIRRNGQPTTFTIREENAIAAIEVMSWFAVDPKWLIYLPPTMSPSETSKHENLLEHPDEAFAFYRKESPPCAGIDDTEGRINYP